MDDEGLLLSFILFHSLSLSFWTVNQMDDEGLLLPPLSLLSFSFSLFLSLSFWTVNQMDDEGLFLPSSFYSFILFLFLFHSLPGRREPDGRRGSLSSLFFLFLHSLFHSLSLSFWTP